MKLTKEGRASLEVRYINAASLNLMTDHALREDAVIHGRIGVKEMLDADLIENAAAFGIEPAPGETNENPFDGRLYMSGSRLVCKENDIYIDVIHLKEDQRAFICKAVNAHTALVALLGTEGLIEGLGLHNDDALKVRAAHEALA